MSYMILCNDNLSDGISYLVDIDPDLARVVSELGYPPLWTRAPGFPTLVQIILEQQVSLASAKAAYNRLLDAANPLTPEKFLEFSDDELKAIGFSRQKSHYCRELSKAILSGSIDLDELEEMDDESARARLMNLKGVGSWTADIYLLMAMMRPDVWPSGDIALASAAQKIKGLSSRPGQEELETIASAWRPWRALAARILWYYYLSHADVNH